MESAVMLGKLPPDQIVPALPKGVWFSAVGEPLEDSERRECESYLRGLAVPALAVSALAVPASAMPGSAASGLNWAQLKIIGVRDWQHARDISNAPNWSRQWWEAERLEERRLFEIAAAKYSADAVLMRLTNLMEGSSELFHGPATVACIRVGIADPGLARSAAGAASHSLHQYGIAQLAGEGEDHLFAVKFRLFLAGRWPLSVDDENFYIF